MPLLLGMVLRQVIMSVASGAVVTGAQELIDGTFKELVFELRDTEGLTEQEAKDVIGNIVIDLAINSASIMAVLRTGIGVKAAEWLGLTSKNFGKAALTPKAVTAAERVGVTGGKDLVKRVIGKIVKRIPSPTALFWVFVAMTQVVEPAIYQPGQMQRILDALGIPLTIPNSAGVLQPGPMSKEDFADYANSLETVGIKGINNPAAMQSQLYSRQALAQLIDWLYGQEVLKGFNPNTTKIIELARPYLTIATTAATASAPSTTTPAGAPNSSSVKVFTGIVSQGVVGKGAEFVARPDDLIESIDELKQAAAINLASYLESLLTKVVYEVKIVSSIVTKDGFKQTGTTQRIESGKDTYGYPKYKTVTNRFAQVVVYALTDKNVRTKLTTINIGPTNSAKLLVGTNDLRGIESELPSLVTTTDINDIKGIETASAITVTAPKSSTKGASTAGGAYAKTLKEWYQLYEASMPSVAVRAKLYEALGLATATFYTASAEQNDRLLKALQELFEKGTEDNDITNLKVATGELPVSNLEMFDQPTQKDEKKKETPTATNARGGISKTPAPKPKTVVRAYTTTSGERVTKYSDGSETRVKVKK